MIISGQTRWKMIAGSMGIAIQAIANRMVANKGSMRGSVMKLSGGTMECRWQPRASYFGSANA